MNSTSTRLPSAMRRALTSADTVLATLEIDRRTAVERRMHLGDAMLRAWVVAMSRDSAHAHDSIPLHGWVVLTDRCLLVLDASRLQRAGRGRRASLRRIRCFGEVHPAGEHTVARIVLDEGDLLLTVPPERAGELRGFLAAVAAQHSTMLTATGTD